MSKPSEELQLKEVEPWLAADALDRGLTPRADSILITSYATDSKNDFRFYAERELIEDKTVQLSQQDYALMRSPAPPAYRGPCYRAAGFLFYCKTAGFYLGYEQDKKQWCAWGGKREREDHCNPWLTATRELWEESGGQLCAKDVKPALIFYWPASKAWIHVVVCHRSMRKMLHRMKKTEVKSRLAWKPVHVLRQVAPEYLCNQMDYAVQCLAVLK